MEQDKKCNGWKNYATWRFNLEYSDSLTNEFLAEIYNNAEAEKYFTKKDNAVLYLRYHLEELAELDFEETTFVSNLMSELLQAAIQDIDFYSLAKSHIEDYLIQKEAA